MSRTVFVLGLLLALASPPRAFAAGTWEWPVRGEILTRYVNGPDPYAARKHRGVDIEAALGTEVVAVAGGTVRFAGTAGSSGRVVSIRSSDGRLDTSYLHLASSSVRKGERVAAGEPIGRVGTSGRRSAVAPHLHFGVRVAGERHAYMDPLPLLGPPPVGERRPRPDPLPAPVPAPVAVAPRPEPARVPSGEPAPRPAPLPRPVPALRPSPVPRPLALPAVPEPLGDPVPRVAPDFARRPQPAPRDARVPDLGGDHEPLRAPAEVRGGAGGPVLGLDLGWALACAGLLLAAAALGRPADRDGPGAGRESAQRLRALLPRAR